MKSLLKIPNSKYTLPFESVTRVEPRLKDGALPRPWPAVVSTKGSFYRCSFRSEGERDRWVAMVREGMAKLAAENQANESRL